MGLKRLLLVALLLSSPGIAQTNHGPAMTTDGVVPTATCTTYRVAVDKDDGQMYCCQGYSPPTAGAWVACGAVAGSGDMLKSIYDTDNDGLLDRVGYGTWAARPGSPTTGWIYVVTDASGAGVCAAGGSASALCRWDGSVWEPLGGGAGSSPGGTDTQVQFNDSGVFEGDDALTLNKTTNDVTVANDFNVKGNNVYVGNNLNEDFFIHFNNLTGDPTLTIDSSSTQLQWPGSLFFDGNVMTDAFLVANDGVIATGIQGMAIGDDTTTNDKCFYARNGDAYYPKFCYNETLNKWEFFDDGQNPVSWLYDEDDTITPDNIMSTGKVDERVLSYESTGDTFEWIDVAATGSGPGGAIYDFQYRAGANDFGGESEFTIDTGDNSVDAKIFNNVLNAHKLATSGTGTLVDPWSGWDVDLDSNGLADLFEAGKRVHFPTGVYETYGIKIDEVEHIHISGEYGTKGSGLGATPTQGEETLILCKGTDTCLWWDNPSGGSNSFHLSGIRFHLQGVMQANGPNGSAVIRIGDMGPDNDSDGFPDDLDSDGVPDESAHTGTFSISDVTVTTQEGSQENAIGLKVTNMNQGSIVNYRMFTQDYPREKLFLKGMELYNYDKSNRGNIVVVGGQMTKVRTCVEIGKDSTITNTVSFYGTKCVLHSQIAREPGTVGIDIHAGQKQVNLHGIQIEGFETSVKSTGGRGLIQSIGSWYSQYAGGHCDIDTSLDYGRGCCKDADCDMNSNGDQLGDCDTDGVNNTSWWIDAGTSQVTSIGNMFSNADCAGMCTTDFDSDGQTLECGTAFTLAAGDHNKVTWMGNEYRAVQTKVINGTTGGQNNNIYFEDDIPFTRMQIGSALGTPALTIYGREDVDNASANLRFLEGVGGDYADLRMDSSNKFMFLINSGAWTQQLQADGDILGKGSLTMGDGTATDRSVIFDTDLDASITADVSEDDLDFSQSIDVTGDVKVSSDVIVDGGDVTFGPTEVTGSAGLTVTTTGTDGTLKFNQVNDQWEANHAFRNEMWHKIHRPNGGPPSLDFMQSDGGAEYTVATLRADADYDTDGVLTGNRHVKVTHGTSTAVEWVTFAPNTLKIGDDTSTVDTTLVFHDADGDGTIVWDASEDTHIFSDDVDVTGNLEVTGSIPAKGVDTSIQWSNAGVLDGDTDFTYNDATGDVNAPNDLDVGNDLDVTGASTLASTSVTSLTSTGTLTFGDGTNENFDMLKFNRAGTDPVISWEEYCIDADSDNYDDVDSDYCGGGFPSAAFNGGLKVTTGVGLRVPRELWITRQNAGSPRIFFGNWKSDWPYPNHDYRVASIGATQDYDTDGYPANSGQTLIFTNAGTDVRWGSISVNEYSIGHENTSDKTLRFEDSGGDGTIIWDASEDEHEFNADVVVAGSITAGSWVSPGADTQVLFTDGSGDMVGHADLTFDDATGNVGIGGDLNLIGALNLGEDDTTDKYINFGDDTYDPFIGWRSDEEDLHLWPANLHFGDTVGYDYVTMDLGVSSFLIDVGGDSDSRPTEIRHLKVGASSLGSVDPALVISKGNYTDATYPMATFTGKTPSTIQVNETWIDHHGRISSANPPVGTRDALQFKSYAQLGAEGSFEFIVSSGPDYGVAIMNTGGDVLLGSSGNRWVDETTGYYTQMATRSVTQPADQSAFTMWLKPQLAGNGEDNILIRVYDTSGTPGWVWTCISGDDCGSLP